MAMVTATRARVVVGASFACDDALARPLRALLDAVVGDGAVHVDWLSYGSLSEPSEWLQVVAPDDESSGHPAVDLLVLLVRVSDLEAAHPELQLSDDAEAQGDRAESSGLEAAGDALETHQQLDAFASDLESYAVLPRDRPPVVVLFCPPPPLLAARHEQLELSVAQRLRRSASHAIEVLPSLHLRDLFQWHYFDPNETNAAPAYYDAVGDHREHAPFSWRMQRVLALAVCRHVRRVVLSPANAKKCIVLDCDNTLWGGAVAEVGAHGLDLSPRFVALQRFVLEQQRAHGLVLCLCSKNIHADVDAAFRERRTDMPLRMDEHIATAKIDWSPKSHNIRAIADELSLGLDSFVFIDDNPVECSEVASALPTVAVVHLPHDFTPSFLHHEWMFDAPLHRLHATKTASTSTNTPAPKTEEDRERTRFYQQNREREQLRHETATHTAFLSSLGIRIEFDELSSSIAKTGSDDSRRRTLQRVLQLHHRTNQFNTATTFSKRMEAGQLDEYAALDGRHVLCARVTDRFGHYGLVSTVLCRRVDDDGPPTLRVDSFLLSCRALNRGVEHAMMRKVAATARRVGATTIQFDWEPTERNQPAQLFFASLSDAAFAPALVNKNGSDTIPKATSATKEERTPGATSGRWLISVEAASRAAFLKPAVPKEVLTIMHNGSKPLLVTIASLVASWWIPVLHFSQGLVAQAFHVLVLPLLPQWLAAPFRRTLQSAVTTAQPFAETPFRTRRSLERFLSSKLPIEEDRDLPLHQDSMIDAEVIDPNEISKFRRKARHQIKLALLDHLHEENPAVVWSANRAAEVEVVLTCQTSSCSTSVPRESTCAFRRCRNCCYRVQRLLHRASSLEAHATARMSAKTALLNNFGLADESVAHLVAGNQQSREPSLGFCSAHRNKRRVR